MSNSIKNVAIVGASGRMGRFITAELLKTGKHTVTAISRAESTATMPAGVAVRKVDYASQASLTAALHGQDALIITMSVTAPPESQTQLFTAAAAAGVLWVLPNEFGLDADNAAMSRDNLIGLRKVAARRQLEDLGVAWLGVTCGFWYEHSLSSPLLYGFDFQRKHLTLYGDGSTPINSSTWPQVGRAVAALLSLPVARADGAAAAAALADYKNRAVYVSSFTITQRDMLAAVLRVSGDPADAWTTEEVDVHAYHAAGVAEMKAGSREGFAKQLYARNFFPDDSGNFGKTRGLQNDVLGLAEEDLDEATKVALDMVAQGIVYA